MYIITVFFGIAYFRVNARWSVYKYVEAIVFERFTNALGSCTHVPGPVSIEALSYTKGRINIGVISNRDIKYFNILSAVYTISQ